MTVINDLEAVNNIGYRWVELTAVTRRSVKIQELLDEKLDNGTWEEAGRFILKAKGHVQIDTVTFEYSPIEEEA